MNAQYATWDRAVTWLTDRLLMAPLFWLDRQIDRAFADFGGED